MDVSLTIESFINTIHGLKLSFGVNESVDCLGEHQSNPTVNTLETMSLNISDNDSMITRMQNKDCEEFWFRSTPFTFPKHQQLLLECCMSISAVCLTMNLLVYAFVAKLRNTPGKCLMSLSLSLLLVIVTYLVSFHIEVSPVSIACVSTALIRLYSFLSAFCWMNVMAFDVYKTFAKSNAIYKLSKNNTKTFVYYSCYAWLTPAMIVVSSLIVQANTPFDSPYNPAYGKTMCCISHFTAMIIFFTCPLSIILTLNVTLFIITAHQLKLTVGQTRLATRRVSAAENQLLLNIKLVLVLGLTWIFGFLGMFVKITLISYMSIVLHGLHGAFIFAVFTVKPKVFRLIRSRINEIRGTTDTQRRDSNESNVSSSKISRQRTHTNSFDASSGKTPLTFKYLPIGDPRNRLPSV